MEQSYKEKYERALAKAKEQYNYPCMRSCMGILEEIFPELAKSEDEWVRKELIDAIRGLWDNDALPMPLSAKRKDEWIAWLENIPATIDHEKREGFHLGYKAGFEKQDGQKPLTIDIKSMVDSYEQRLIKNGGVNNSPLVNMCIAAFKHGVENTLDELHLKQGETSPTLSNSSNIGKDEQKPTWSEEDKKEYKYVLKFVDNILNNCGNKKDYEHCKRCYDWLKSLKQRIGG